MKNLIELEYEIQIQQIKEDCAIKMTAINEQMIEMTKTYDQEKQKLIKKIKQLKSNLKGMDGEYKSGSHRRGDKSSVSTQVKPQKLIV